MSPLISVIIPTHNAAHHISHALDAILSQTYEPLEILIVDDNSTDNLREIIDPYLKNNDHIQYVRLPYDDPYRFNLQEGNINAGWMARNYGVERARGEFITFQDADDGSCSNRMQVQYDLMMEYEANHVNVDWQQYRDEYNGKFLDYQIRKEDIIGTEEILSLAKKNTRGLFRRPFGKCEEKNPIEKFIRKVNRKYIGEYDSYPCAASMPLLKKEVFEKCRFRPLWERTRPSLRGRGADQDFNYWVAETFQKSIAVTVPLILWRVKSQNPLYEDEIYRPVDGS